MQRETTSDPVVLTIHAQAAALERSGDRELVEKCFNLIKSHSSRRGVDWQALNRALPAQSIDLHETDRQLLKSLLAVCKKFSLSGLKEEIGYADEADGLQQGYRQLRSRVSNNTDIQLIQRDSPGLLSALITAFQEENPNLIRLGLSFKSLFNLALFIAIAVLTAEGIRNEGLGEVGSFQQFGLALTSFLGLLVLCSPCIIHYSPQDDKMAEVLSSLKDVEGSAVYHLWQNHGRPFEAYFSSHPVQGVPAVADQAAPDPVN